MTLLEGGLIEKKGELKHSNNNHDHSEEKIAPELEKSRLKFYSSTDSYLENLVQN